MLKLVVCLDVQCRRENVQFFLWDSSEALNCFGDIGANSVSTSLQVFNFGYHFIRASKYWSYMKNTLNLSNSHSSDCLLGMGEM
jgi:hypothetical protein